MRPKAGAIATRRDGHPKLRRAQDLLRHAGTVDPAEVLDRALTLLVAQLERKKAGVPPRPERKAASRPSVVTAAASAEPADTSPPPVAKRADGGAAREPTARTRRSRYIPAAVRHAVWERDGARCAYVSPRGIRCSATSRLEFHHRVPFGDGGPTSVDNVALACTLHNQAEAERWFNFDWTEFGPNGSARRASRRQRREGG